MPAPSPAPASVPSPGRRALLAATAWGVPAVSLTVASPAHALSGDSVTARLAQSRVQPGDVTTLTATLVDGQGAPVSGRGVAVSPSVDGITANPASGATDAQGEFSSRITVGTEVPVGDHAISVSTASGGTSTVLSVAGALLLTLSSTRLRSDAEVTARVRLLDTQGQPAAGQSITFEGAGAAVFADRLLQTDADGSAQTFLRGDRTQAPGRFTVRAYDENGDSDSVDVVVVAPVELTIDPVSVERGATARAQVFAYDARANPEAGRTISISVMEVVDGTSRASTWITADPSSVTTGSDGRAVVDLVAASDAPAKSYTVTASDGNDSASAALEVLAPAVPLTVVLAPSLVPWGGSSRVSVTVTNSDHTRVADADVTIGWASDDLSVSPTSGRTDQNGVFAAVAQVSAAPASSGSRRITATTGASRGDADLVIDAVRQRLTDFARPSQVVVTDSTAWVLDGDRLSMFDTSSRTSTRAVTLPATCQRIAASSRHDPAWIYLATGDGRVFVYDVAVGAISSTIRRPGTSRDATQIAVHDTAARAYVTLPRDGAVMVIDTGTNTYLTSIGVSWPVGVAGGRGSFRTLFYVVDRDGVLHSRDAADNTQRSTLELGAPTDLTAPMVVDAEGERAYIVASDGESTRLVVVDLRGWQVLARVDLGSARPGGVALSPTGDRLFISTISPALITDVSCRTYEVRKTLNAGDAPSSIAVQDASTAYVTNYSTTQPGVSVIDVR